MVGLQDLEGMTSLPPLPQVYEKISRLSRDPHSDLKEWIEVIKFDPMTCATILRHANALAYGFKGEVIQIDRAVMFHAGDHMLHHDTHTGNEPIDLLIVFRQLFPFGFFLGLIAHNPFGLIALIPSIFEQTTPLRVGRLLFITALFIMLFAFMGLT